MATMKMRSEADMEEQIQELKTITRLQGEPIPRGPAYLGYRSGPSGHPATEGRPRPSSAGSHHL